MLWERQAKDKNSTKEELLSNYELDYAETADKMIRQLLKYASDSKDSRSKDKADKVSEKNKGSKRDNSEENRGAKENRDVRKRLYHELCSYYDENDSNFARLSATHAKIAWLVYIGLMLVMVFLVLGQDKMQELPVWMLFGASGALLSRCLRFLKATKLLTEYGVYWILLFLSPVYGALAGVASVLLFHLLIEIKILSPDTFGRFFLNDPSGMYARLALAILSGLSERWLDKLIKQTEEINLSALQKGKDVKGKPTSEKNEKTEENNQQNQQQENRKPEKDIKNPRENTLTN